MTEEQQQQLLLQSILLLHATTPKTRSNVKSILVYYQREKKYIYRTNYHTEDASGCQFKVKKYVKIDKFKSTQ